MQGQIDMLSEKIAALTSTAQSLCEAAALLAGNNPAPTVKRALAAAVADLKALSPASPPPLQLSPKVVLPPAPKTEKLMLKNEDLFDLDIREQSPTPIPPPITVKAPAPATPKIQIATPAPKTPQKKSAAAADDVLDLDELAGA